MRLMRVGMLRVLWKQASIRSSVSGSLRWIVLCLYGSPRRAGLYTAITIGVVMNVVNNAISTHIANAWSSSTCIHAFHPINQYILCTYKT